MTASCEFDAAAHVLRAPCLIHATEAHIDDSRCDIQWESILELPWSDGQQVLIDLAFELWTGHSRGESSFCDLFRYVDEESFDRAVDALLIRRGRTQAVA